MARVLIVDDEPEITKCLGRLFRQKGFEVELALGGEEALQKLDPFQPDVVISDFRMPKMNGAELLGIVKQRAPLALRLILSGYADVGSTVASVNEGEICRFLSKPWDDTMLIETVKQLLTQRDTLASLLQAFEPLPLGVSMKAEQHPSKLVLRAEQSGQRFTVAQAVSLIGQFAGDLRENAMEVVSGLLERHAGTVTFVACVGGDQTLTVELPTSLQVQPALGGL